jgi:hypothetical protein
VLSELASLREAVAELTAGQALLLASLHGGANGSANGGANGGANGVHVVNGAVTSPSARNGGTALAEGRTPLNRAASRHNRRLRKGGDDAIDGRL